MNPDVVRAIDDLEAKGILPAEIAPRLRMVAAGDLISVRRELEILLYFGVALIVAGVGLLVEQNLDRIGPLIVAVAIGAAALGCLIWCWLKGKRTDLAFEYVLTLGALLVAADLAFIEVKFTPLGEHWPLHLLIVAVFYALLAFKFDSRSVFGLALTAFAAWRGVSLQLMTETWWRSENELFIEAVLCGALFIILGRALERFRRKAHFEPVAFWLGALLLLAALAKRMTSPPNRTAVATLLVAAGAFLAWWAWDEKRIGRFSLGVAGVGSGVWGLLWRGLSSVHAPLEAHFFAFAAVAAIVVIIVLRANRSLRRSP
ncbi:MAG TPA: DUF2157 domain-containing protein [Candidatus Polarisedimenticolaceae bacterium]|nr:DUF2157 domain-containing protein [Candidatus Polarisedimenticolaceae bacterium]